MAGPFDDQSIPDTDPNPRSSGPWYAQVIDALLSAIRDRWGRFTGTPWADVTHPDYGAVADSTGPGVGTDCTAAIQAAVTAAPNGVVFLPRNANGYRVTGQITCSSPVKIKSHGARIIVDIPDASGNTPVFSVQSDDVTVEGVWFDGTGKVGTPTGNRYGVQAVGTDDTHRYHRIKVRRCRFTALDTGFYGGTKPATTLVFHGVFFDFCEDVAVEHCDFNQLSGAASFFRRSNHTASRWNRVHNCCWYPIHHDGGNVDSEVCGNSITADDPNASYWGAPIDFMGQNMGSGGNYGSDYKARVHHNYISGYTAYGNDAAVRVCSTQHIEIDHNVFDGILNPVVIRVFPRQVDGADNGLAPVDVNIHHNVAIAGVADQMFVYATGTQNSVGTGTVGPSRLLRVNNNTVDSVDSTHYFAAVLALHGQDGGWQDYAAHDNYCRGNPGSGSGLLAGLIGVASTGAANPVSGGSIEGNEFVFFDGAGGVGANTADNAIFIQQYAKEVHIGGNKGRDFYYGIRVGTNAGPNITGVWHGNNRFQNSQGGDVNWASGVVGESIPSLASANTLTLTSPRFVHWITGTTQIQTIAADGQEGRVVTLVFAGVLTVKDNTGNLRLAGDFTTAASSTLTLASDGALWYEVSRSTN